ncbi:hypothetical protein GYMLUDRAFT_156158, partial [Collybiopsis luxurians FD-317 M1]
YRQALSILSSKDTLTHTMADLNIASPSVFPEWLKSEWQYLKGLKREPPEETMQMEYFQKLV